MGSKPPLARSAFEKFERAGQYIDELELGITSWLATSHTVRTDFFPEVREGCYYVRQRRTVPDDWPLLAGDAIHNLRAALDHIVWGLTIRHQRYQPIQPVPSRCKWRRVGFPVQESPQGTWPPVPLWGVHSRVSHAIREEQPSQPGKERSPLWVLNELWNRDKHRSVFSVEGAVRVDTWNAPAAVIRAAFGKNAEAIPGLEVEGVEHIHRGPLSLNEEVEMLCVRFRAFPDEHTVRRYMKANARLTVDVHFDKSSPALGRAVRPLMREMQARVAGVLDRLVDEFNPRQIRIPARPHTCPP